MKKLLIFFVLLSSISSFGQVQRPKMKTAIIRITIDGQGGTASAGLYGGYIYFPYSCTITSWVMNTGSETPINTNAQFSILKKSSFYPTAADSITTASGSVNNPHLTAATNGTGTCNFQITAGDWIAFSLLSNSSAVIINLELIGTK